MNVFELHPDDLLDKASEGTITPLEQARLDAHLKTCVACRFEPLAQSDFQEAMDVDAAMASQIAALVPHAPRVPRLSRSGFAKARIATLAAAAVVALSAVSVAAWVPVSRALGIAAPPAPLTAHVRPSSKASKGSGGPGTTAPNTVPMAVDESAQTAAPVDEIPVAEPAQEAKPTAVPTAVERTLIATSPRSNATRALPVNALPAPEVSAFDTSNRIAAAPSAKATAARLFTDAVRAEREGDSSRALSLYGELERSFPGTVEAETARASSGQLLLDHGAPNEALVRFDAYLARGGERLREEVVVGRAYALERLHREGDEAHAWSTLIETFPGSPHAGHARARLANIAGH